MCLLGNTSLGASAYPELGYRAEHLLSIRYKREQYYEPNNKDSAKAGDSVVYNVSDPGCESRP